jgi:hypothetical protein
MHAGLKDLSDWPYLGFFLIELFTRQHVSVAQRMRAARKRIVTQIPSSSAFCFQVRTKGRPRPRFYSRAAFAD